MQKNYIRMNWLNCVTHVIIMSLSVSRVIGKKHDMSAWNANFLGKHQFANYIFCQNKAEAKQVVSAIPLTFSAVKDSSIGDLVTD